MSNNCSATKELPGSLIGASIIHVKSLNISTFNFCGGGNPGDPGDPGDPSDPDDPGTPGCPGPGIPGAKSPCTCIVKEDPSDPD